MIGRIAGEQDESRFMACKSYTSRTVGPFSAAIDFYHQFRAVRRQVREIDRAAEQTLEDCRRMEGYIDRDLSACDVVELGSGQMPSLLIYLTTRSRSAVGFDLDVVPQGLRAGAYARMLRHNGLKRTLKSLGREVLGFNRAMRRGMARALGRETLPAVDLRVGDVSRRIDLPDASVDVVCSSDLFEHLAEPETTMREMVRVLRPGGVAMARTWHWANANALHDIRVITGQRRGRWAHLRPSIRHESQQGAFINQVRIGEWRAIFEKHLDGVTALGTPHPEAAWLGEELARARAAGELEGYSDEELLTQHWVVRGVKRG